MDNYNVLVLMQKDPLTNEFLDTVLSVQMEEGLENVSKAFVSEENQELFINLFLTTPDVEDWEFFGIYEEYTEELYEELGGILEEYEDYNPAWLLKIPYAKEDSLNEQLIRKAVKMHYSEILRLKSAILSKKEEYMRLAEESNS